MSKKRSSKQTQSTENSMTEPTNDQTQADQNTVTIATTEENVDTGAVQQDTKPEDTVQQEPQPAPEDIPAAPKEPEPLAEQPVIQPEQLIAPAPAPVAEEKAQSDFEKLIEKVQQSGSPGEKLIVTSLMKYSVDMAPGKPIEQNKQAANQQALWRTLLTAVNNETDFNKCFTLLIAFFAEYKDTCFGDRYVFRFMEQMTIGADQLKAFQSMLNILKLASGLANKKDIKKFVDLDRAITEVFKEPTRQRIMNYFM